MKGKISMAFLLLIFVSDWAFYVFAQGEGGDSVVGHAEVINTPAVLCTGPHLSKDGIMTYKWLPNSGTLRIDMLDGSVHEINL
jgi:hypothetical protein